MIKYRLLVIPFLLCFLFWKSVVLDQHSLDYSNFCRGQNHPSHVRVTLQFNTKEYGCSGGRNALPIGTFWQMRYEHFRSSETCDGSKHRLADCLIRPLLFFSPLYEMSPSYTFVNITLTEKEQHVLSLMRDTMPEDFNTG